MHWLLIVPMAAHQVLQVRRAPYHFLDHLSNFLFILHILCLKTYIVLFYTFINVVSIQLFETSTIYLGFQINIGMMTLFR